MKLEYVKPKTAARYSEQVEQEEQTLRQAQLSGGPREDSADFDNSDEPVTESQSGGLMANISEGIQEYIQNQIGSQGTQHSKTAQDAPGEAQSSETGEQSSGPANEPTEANKDESEGGEDNQESESGEDSENESGPVPPEGPTCTEAERAFLDAFIELQKAGQLLGLTPSMLNGSLYGKNFLMVPSGAGSEGIWSLGEDKINQMCAALIKVYDEKGIENKP